MRLIIEMPWERDLSVNHMRYGAGGGYRKKEHVQAWMERLAFHIRPHVVGGYFVERTEEYLGSGQWSMNESHALIQTPIKVVVDFRYPDKRRRDDHNFYKVICDAVAAGLGIDDKDIRISTGTVEVDRDNSGFTISIQEESDD